jgi:hypothetical protein
MIRYLPLFVLLVVSGGCQFYRNVIVDENGQFLPWHANRDNPQYQKRWEKEKAEWEIKDAERRYRADMIDRYQYNQIRKRHGLEPIL